MLTMEEIREKVVPIAARYDVAHVDLFGSYASGSATPESDVDFLVEFSPAVPSIFKVMGFQEELRRSLGLDIDVITLPLASPERLVVNKKERIV
ncbi:MAG: nucleotidyltransferase domain-containing protein [Chitinispirillia bacterium]|nr:nucleotidyltransferase domain-containing protein [Chitinispirillia bacterium]MCL2242400.1 nucleotidyltransferase domain-containing protein [Chitinispirillia bacterium]